MVHPDVESVPKLDLLAWLRAFQTEAKRSVGERLHVTIDGEGELVVAADPAELDSMFTNLLVSLRVGMRAAGKIVIRAAAVPGRAFAEVQIEEQGHTLSPELFRRILRPMLDPVPPGGYDRLKHGGHILFDLGERPANIIHLRLPLIRASVALSSAPVLQASKASASE